MKNSACIRLRSAVQKSIIKFFEPVFSIHAVRFKLKNLPLRSLAYVRSNVNLLAFTAFLPLMQSCTVFTFYNPHSGHTPSVKNKNEVEIAAASGNTGELGMVSYYSLNASYGVRDSQVVSVSGFYGNSGSSSGTRSRSLDGRHYSYELSYGVLKPLGRHSGVYLIGGAGYGGNEYNYTQSIDGSVIAQSRMVDYVRTSFSTALSLNADDYFEFSISPRLTYVHFNRIVDKTPFTNEFENTFSNLYSNRNLFFFEPYINIKTGGKLLKLYLQYTITQQIGEQVEFRHGTSNLSLGVQFNIVP